MKSGICFFFFLASPKDTQDSTFADLICQVGDRDADMFAHERPPNTSADNTTHWYTFTVTIYIYIYIYTLFGDDFPIKPSIQPEGFPVSQKKLRLWRFRVVLPELRRGHGKESNDAFIGFHVDSTCFHKRLWSSWICILVFLDLP